MIRRLLPLLIASLLATGATAQSPGGGLASIPHRGEPDNFDDDGRIWHDFLEEQCTPRSFLETGQPIVDCTYWTILPIAIPGPRRADQPTMYIRLARLKIIQEYLEEDDEDIWKVGLSYWISEDNSRPTPEEIRSGGGFDVGYIGYDEEPAFPLDMDFPLRKDGKPRLFVNTHGAIIYNLPVYSYLPNVEPIVMRLEFNRDPTDFDPAANLPDALRNMARQGPTTPSDEDLQAAIEEIERLTGQPLR